MIPLLLRPSLLAMKNTWFRSTPAVRILKAAGLPLLLVLPCLVYLGSSSSFTQALQQYGAAHMKEQLLSPLLLAFLAILFFSSLVYSFGQLFCALDCERLISSPVRTTTIFAGRISELLLAAAWLVTGFMLPILLAYGVDSGAPWSYYLRLLPALGVLMLTGTAGALIVALLLGAVFPFRRLKEILLVVGTASIWLIYGWARGSVSRGRSSNPVEVQGATAGPSLWAAEMLSGEKWGLPLAKLCLLTVLLLSLAIVVFHYWYRKGVARSLESRHRNVPPAHRPAFRWRLPLSPPVRAIVGKEFKLFLRDASQALQLLLIIGLCLVYLFNFELLQAIQPASPPRTPLVARCAHPP